MKALKDDGLISNLADYMALDERVLDDWRLLKEAQARMAETAARRAAAR